MRVGIRAEADVPRFPLCLAFHEEKREMKLNVVRFSLAATAFACTGLLPSIGRAVTASDEDQIRAVVESVDLTSRHVSLRGPQGGLVTITAGPEVRNLQQVKPGDNVVVTYREALAAELAKPGSSAPPPQIVESASRAAPGSTPRASKEQMIKARVQITGVDHKHNRVSFIGPAKVERTVDVTEPDMQNFLQTLKVGDEVDLTYTEAIAVSVERQQTQSLPLKTTTHFVYFSTGSHALTPEDQDHIRDVATMMQSTPTFVATIVGKTDSVGSADFNEHLSQRRAEAVFEALVYTNKVPENRVQLRWTGERLPFISAADEEAESHNRMAAIIVNDTASAH